nr:recombinase family protein [uncultured Cellulosilyticum sp.]
MRIAIYARKSKLTDKGESIDNQINECKNYILSEGIANTEFIIFKDEGFSGRNTQRPEFQKLLKAAKNHDFDILICYRLDRVSRSVADFSNTYNLLEKHGINFISVKEKFDTNSPIGRAMLNISMVFAQLERETIAERIRDNMLALARTGRWLGGITPTGFTSEPINYYDNLMHPKKMYQLIPVQSELNVVQTIFNKFTETKSLRGVESYLLTNNILSKNNCKYTADTIRDILRNPVYVATDEAIYEYLHTMGCTICNEKKDFTGESALMIYNKKEKKGTQMIPKTMNQWIVAIGKRAPLISGTEWVRIQQTLDRNASKNFFKGTDAEYGLLSSLIKCKFCGSTMRLKKGKRSKTTGKIAFTYVCNTKELTHRKNCNCPNLVGQDADTDVIDYLISLTSSTSFIRNQINITQLNIVNDICNIDHQLKILKNSLIENQNDIDNLMIQMTKADESLVQHFMNKLKELDAKQKSLQKELSRIKTNQTDTDENKLNIALLKNSLDSLKLLNETSDIKLQRSIIRTLIHQIIWDGKELDIQLYGVNDYTTFCRHSKALT